MLRVMQTSTASSPSPTPETFAGLLATIAHHAQPAPAPETDGFADDVATLSYAQALGAQTAAYLDEDTNQSQTNPVKTAAVEPEPGEETRSFISVQAVPRKSASITLRLTAEEDELLRERAAEAGMTVSSYLRACAFEVESLRTQVKLVLAELKLAAAAPAHAAVKPVPQPIPQPAPRSVAQQPVAKEPKSNSWLGFFGRVSRSA